MKRRAPRALAVACLLLAALPAAVRAELVRDPGSTELVNRDADGVAADRVRALLTEAARRATADLSRPKGYERADDTRLPMPEAAKSTVALMLAAGHARLVDQMMMDINRGVEAAAGKAMPALEDVIAHLPVDDAPAVLSATGAEATALLCADRAPLEDAYAPVLRAGLTEAGYFRSLQILVDNYNQIPVLTDIEPFDVEPELRQRAVNGICLRLADEERRLRAEPAWTAPAALPEPPAPVAQDARPVKIGKAERRAIETVRELLGVAGARAVAALSRPGGYLKNPALRIPLPAVLEPAATALRSNGLVRYVDDLESDINVSAEIAAPQVWPALQAAIADMPVLDASVMLQGDDTAATQALRRAAEGRLLEALRPVVATSLRRTGGQDSLRAFLEQAAALGVEKPPAVDIDVHVAGGASEGLFRAIGEEERAIRHDPGKRGTKLLRKAFATPGD